MLHPIELRVYLFVVTVVDFVVLCAVVPVVVVADDVAMTTVVSVFASLPTRFGS